MQRAMELRDELARNEHSDGRPALTQDAALCIAIVATALPFARDVSEEVDRWLRALRLHGRAGQALQALGVGERRLAADAPLTSAQRTGAPGLGPRVVDEVVARSVAAAKRRGGDCADTADVLEALIAIYGPAMADALEDHGSSLRELRARLARSLPTP